MESVVNYKCPGCGAALVFSAEKQLLECPYCDSCFDPNKAEDIEALSSAMAGQAAAPEALDESAAVAYTCPSCGSRVVTDRHTSATFCTYCHSPAMIQSQLTGEFRPARLIPFKTTPEQALEALKKMSRGMLLPPLFRQAMKKGEVTGLYVPCWIFDARCKALLAGKGSKVSRWSDTTYDYVKTDTHRILRAATMRFENYPAYASGKIAPFQIKCVEPYRLAEMVDFEQTYLAGYYAESYSSPAENYAGEFDRLAKVSAQNKLLSTLPAYDSRDDVKTEYDCTEQSSEYVLLPLWTVMVEDDNERYRFIMNGQTGKINGTLPVSKKRSLLLFLKLWGVLSAAILLTGMLIRGLGML